MQITPITLEVFKNKFASVAEEMGMALTRTAYSPNIKERRDFSCAVFNAAGEMVAQAAHIPVHLGSMPLSVAAAIEAVELGPGDMAMLNDPFRGGTHLPDITLVAPVFAGGDAPLFYVASRAHHADVGGMSAGSMPLSTSIFQEGLIIPPVKIVAGGEIVPDVMSLFLANVRTPVERQGDFAAQIMANRTGIARLEALATANGRDSLSAMAGALIDYAARLMTAAVAAMPDGVYTAEDVLDDDGAGSDEVAVRLTLTIDGDTAELDFTKSDPQTAGCVNAVRAITVSAAFFVLRALAGDMPTNAGCLRPLTVRTRPGSVVDARFPAAVAGGNVETSQRIVDVILAALAQALPGRIPAASQGTMNNVAMGGSDPRTGAPFTYYETLAGGAGADAAGAGQSAVHSHMTNTRKHAGGGPGIRLSAARDPLRPAPRLGRPGAACRRRRAHPRDRGPGPPGGHGALRPPDAWSVGAGRRRRGRAGRQCGDASGRGDGHARQVPHPAAPGGPVAAGDARRRGIRPGRLNFPGRPDMRPAEPGDRARTTDLPAWPGLANEAFLLPPHPVVLPISYPRLFTQHYPQSAQPSRRPGREAWRKPWNIPSLRSRLSKRRST